MSESGIKNKILVVDDDLANRIILTGILKKANYEVIQAENGLAGLDKAKHEKPDLVLLDILMPGMDGYEVCKKLKSDPETKSISIIFISALGNDADQAKGLELGAVDYIAKPISPPIVKARVNNYLRLKNAIEELEQKNRDIELSAALREEVERITRHDLKTPLSGIMGFAGILDLQEDVKPEFKDLVQRIRASSKRMLNMIDLSLDLFKMEKGTYQIIKDPVILIPIVKKIINETHTVIRNKKLTVEILCQGQEVVNNDDFIVYSDEVLCYSMFANLIKNAIEASPRESKIIINMDDDDECNSRVCIRNKGAVPKEIRARFFEKYITSGKQKGTGLGTYSSKLIVDNHHGNISLASSEATGTCITVILPKIID